MAVQLDAKQKHRIDTWIAMAEPSDTDSYMGFMSLWIAFNAYCYAAYRKSAVQEQAYLGIKRGLLNLSEAPLPVEGSIYAEAKQKRIKLTLPDRIDLRIKTNYTENLIFDSFASDADMLSAYEILLREPRFASAIKELQLQLEKGDFSFVINMARIEESSFDYENLTADQFVQLAHDSIIVPFPEVSNLGVVRKVLYQIRSNVFHGGKIPGNLNDDGIVKAAIPVLKQLLNSAMLHVVVDA